MSDRRGAVRVGMQVAERGHAPELTDKVCTHCLQQMVRWGKTLFCPRCDRSNGSRKPGRSGPRTKSPRAWGRLSNQETSEQRGSPGGGTGEGGGKSVGTN